MTDAAYVQWCKLFVEFINELRQQKAPGVENEKLWVILYLDGYGSHALNPEALEILHDGCIRESIALACRATPRKPSKLWTVPSSVGRSAA